MHFRSIILPTLVLIFGLSGSLFAQSTDSQILKAHILKHKRDAPSWHQGAFEKTKNPFKYILQGGIWLYQKDITYQLYSHCIYHTSCSEYSRKLLAGTNLMTAGFLTIDRLSRCNPLEAKRLEKMGFIHRNGRYSDSPELYLPHAE